MNFREAKAEDIQALSEVRLSVRENVLSDPRRVTREMYEDYLCDSGKGWLCEDGGEVVGFTVASLKDDSIWALFVKPSHEGRGIGRRLLRAAAGWLFESGARSVMLTTAPGTRAEGFYLSQGWRRGELTPDGEVRFTLERRRRPGPDASVIRRLAD